MREVKFYDTIDEERIKFAVIIARYEEKWIFCKHRNRDTFEVPGGHREYVQGDTKWAETPMEAARRELQEETGAFKYQITPISIYSVEDKSQPNGKGEDTYGLLCYAEISEFNTKLESEIEYIRFFDNIPDNLTYPDIQPKLLEKVKSVIQ